MPVDATGCRVSPRSLLWDTARVRVTGLTACEPAGFPSVAPIEHHMFHHGGSHGIPCTWKLVLILNFNQTNCYVPRTLKSSRPPTRTPDGFAGHLRLPLRALPWAPTGSYGAPRGLPRDPTGSLWGLTECRVGSHGLTCGFARWPQIVDGSVPTRALMGSRGLYLGSDEVRAPTGSRVDSHGVSRGRPWSLQGCVGSVLARAFARSHGMRASTGSHAGSHGLVLGPNGMSRGFLRPATPAPTI